MNNKPILIPIYLSIFIYSGITQGTTQEITNGITYGTTTCPRQILCHSNTKQIVCCTGSLNNRIPILYGTRKACKDRHQLNKKLQLYAVRLTTFKMTAMTCIYDKKLQIQISPTTKGNLYIPYQAYSDNSSWKHSEKHWVCDATKNNCSFTHVKVLIPDMDLTTPDNT